MHSHPQNMKMGFWRHLLVLNASLHLRKNVLKHKLWRVIKSKSVQRGCEKFFPFPPLPPHKAFISFSSPLVFVCICVEVSSGLFFFHLNLFNAHKPLCSCACKNNMNKSTTNDTILDCIMLARKLVLVPSSFFQVLVPYILPNFCSSREREQFLFVHLRTRQ